MKRLAGDRRLDQWNHDGEGNNTEQHGMGGLTALQARDSRVEAGNAMIGLPESLVNPLHVQIEMIEGDHRVELLGKHTCHASGDSLRLPPGKP